MLENFRRAFSPGPTDCPWVSEDDLESDACRFTFHVKVTIHLSGFYSRLARADSRSKPRVWFDLTVTFVLLPFF